MEKHSKKTSPLENANIFAYFTFGYVLKLLKKGWRNNLGKDDLYGLPVKCKSQINGKIAIKQWNKTPSLFKLLVYKFGIAYVLFCTAHVVWTEIRSFLRPYGMSRLITYFDKKQTTISETEAYYCASIVVFMKIFQFFFMQHMLVFEVKYIIQLKTSLQSLLYEKILRLSTTSILETSSGNLITVMTKDIFCVEMNIWIIKDFIIFIVQAATVFYLIWSKVGISACSTILMYLIALPLQGYLCSVISRIKLTAGKHADERVQITQEVLAAIRVIKMYTWEKFFIGKISESRSKEVAAILKMLMLHFVLVIIGLFVSGITFLVLISTYLWLGNETNTELVFYINGLFHELTMSMGVMIPVNMSRTAELFASLRRINKVFQCSEISKIEKIYKEALIDINNASVEIKNKRVVDDLTLKISKPGLNVITGSVGSGKSSIFHIIIGLHNLVEGYCKMGGTISFAAQEPWLFPSSIKNNILFGGKFDKERYEQILRICGLDYDLSHLQDGDETIVAEGGLNLSKGQKARINLARCVYKDSDIYLLDDPLNALDAHVQDFIFEECICKFLKDKICILICQNSKHVEKAHQVFTLVRGKLISNDMAGIILEEGKDETNATESLEKKPLDKAVPQEGVTNYTNHDLFDENREKGTIKLDVYKSYIQYGGGFIFFGVIIIVYILSQGVHLLSEKLFSKWVDLQGTNSTVLTSGHSYTKEDYLHFYSITLISSSLVSLLNLYVLLRFTRNASFSIHKAMIARVVTAIMNFFDTHYLGNVVNRFSYDLNIIDERLPIIFLHLFRAIFGCLGIFILISTVNWFLLVPSLIFVATIVLMRILYINTGRNLKRLEASTRSPLVGHINSTLDGLSTIRAFDAERQLADEFYRHQDTYSSAVFTMRVTEAAFGFFMGILSTTFSTLIIAKFLFYDEDTTAGNVGLVLTNVLRISDLIQWGVKEWIEVETNMTSVERCLEYTNLNQEIQPGKDAEDWPKVGHIVYKHVDLKYGSEKIPVLRNINFTVRPNQNIGIVGRTGAGKSSIVSTLFRLYEYGGTIEIDGENIKNLYLNVLRKNIAIIPQDPILFTGTIRENIDPYQKYSDEKIWSLLRKLMIDDIKSLDDPVSNFSAGQKQLLCMARAAIQNCKIIVLDEITANMDAENDELIHSLVKQVFRNCTIFTIAHRLNFIMSCDKVIVMENGEIVEFDEPEVLVKDKTSLFSKICDKANF